MTDKSEAPDLIDATVGGAEADDGTWSAPYNLRGELMPVDEGYRRYVPEDHALAREAAAYEASALKLTDHEGVPCKPNENWNEEFSDGYETGQVDASISWENAIRALTPADASAALDRLLAEERRRMVDIAAQFHPSDPAHCVIAALRAEAEKEGT